MTVRTITIPDADDQQQLVYNKRARASGQIILPVDTKLACVLLELHPDVTPANYAAIGVAIEAVTGINGVTMVVDGQTPASIPEDTELRLCVDVHLRIDDLPEEPE